MPDFLHALQSVLRGFGPPHLAAAVALLVLYSIQAELRFGKSARASTPGAADRGSTRAISLAFLVPVLGLILAIKASTNPDSHGLAFFGLSSPVAMPAMPALGWLGVAIGALGLPLRLWAVLTLRERYTRTLLVHEKHEIERRGPYGFVRHPGYLGSLFTLNGIALATGNAAVLVASLAATLAAYAHRIRVEDAMLVASFGDSYEAYRREVRALIPLLW
jgi:protein-S-isoprenylcysteine O-methyltransferase Ste14